MPIANELRLTVADVGNVTLSVVGGSLTAGGDWITFAGDPPGTGCAGGKTCTFYTNLAIAAGSSANVKVQCNPPPGAFGEQSETLTFTSDSLAGLSSHTTVTCTVEDVIFFDTFDSP